MSPTAEDLMRIDIGAWLGRGVFGPAARQPAAKAKGA